MSERTVFWLVFLSSVVSSIGGLVFCVVIRDTADAGRGGDAGAAIALGFMFVTRDYGVRLYQVLTKEMPDLKARIARLKNPDAPAITVKPDLSEKFDTLLDAIALDGQGRQTENRFLAIATCVGILISGFGEMIAVRIIQGFA
jgi:hypothetical protein